MKIKISNSIFIILILFLSGCAYFNTFYNAEQAYKDAEKIIDETKKQEEGDIPQQAKKLLSLAIEKSRIVIDDYPNSKYVDDAFYLVGKSSFIKDDYQYAKKHFRQLLTEYPKSKFVTESRIWLAYTFLRMDEYDSTNATIKFLEDSGIKLQKNHKQLIFKIRGELAIQKGLIEDAYKYFEEAIKFAAIDGKKASMYEDLVRIAEKNNDVENIIYFLEKLDLYAQSDEIKHEAKLKWIRYNREQGKLQIVQDEINKLLSRSDYESLFLSLELERVKILLSLRDIESARKNLLYIVENNSKKKETAESYYLLGLYNLTHNWDLDKAKEYLEKVGLEYSRSIYKEPARDLKNTINVFQGLETIFSSLQSGDTNAVEFEVDEEEKQEDQIFDMSSFNSNQNMGNNPSGQNLRRDMEEDEQPKTVVIKGTMDSLLFAMGEILYFDFQQLDSAISRFEYLYEYYPESKFTPQAVYVLSKTTADSLQWKETLMNEFPKSEYVINGDVEFVPQEKIQDLDDFRDIAWEFLDSSPQTSAESFLALADSTNDPASYYAAAYINDYYLNELENSIQYYQTYIDSFPDHEFVRASQERLSAIQQAIEDTFQVVADSIDTDSDSINFEFIEEDIIEEDFLEFFPELPPSFIIKDSIEIQDDIIFQEIDTSVIISILEDESEYVKMGPASVLPVELGEPTLGPVDSIKMDVDGIEIDVIQEVEKTDVPNVKQVAERKIFWKNYMVQSGETIESIANRYYNNILMADSIYQWNKDIIGNDPTLIFPFTSINLQNVEGDTSIQEIEYSEYTVISGESLWEISDKIYGNPYMWMLLFTDNLDTLEMEKDFINPGDILMIRESFKTGNQ